MATDISSMIDSTSNKVRGFWERPEGRTGMITIVAIIGGALLLMGPIGAAVLGGLSTLSGIVVGLTGLALKTAMLTVACSILFGLYLILTSDKFQALCSYAFKSAMRAITGIFIEIDPIGIMKDYIDDLKERKATLIDRIGRLWSQITICKRQIDKNKTNQEASIHTAQVARKAVLAGDTRMANQFSLNARNAGRLQKSNLTLEDLLKRMVLIHTALGKYKDAAEVVIQDLTSEVEVKSEERAAILAGVSAIRAAKSILMGGGNKREMFDQAMEFVVNDYGQKLGEIESFMDDSKPFIDGLDLQNGVYEEQALEQLKAWSEKADSILLGKDKMQMIEHFESDGNVIPSMTASKPIIGVSAGDDFQKFFTKS